MIRNYILLFKFKIINGFDELFYQKVILNFNINYFNKYFKCPQKQFQLFISFQITFPFYN
jgi:hypothetical protein